jgi:hypothetical protein
MNKPTHFYHSIAHLLLVLLLAKCSLQQNNAVNVVRHQCEYKQGIAEFLLLNCSLAHTLINGLVIPSNSPNIPDSPNSISINSNVDTIKVGTDSSWRSPWDSITVNFNIVRTLIWRNSRLSELGEYTFKDLTYLNRIDLAYNKLQFLHPSSFNLIESDVLELDLSGNLFHNVPDDLFRESKRFSRLEVLKMNENPIVELTYNSFGAIYKTIKTIELNHCQIRSIELDAFADARHLESLSLVGNHLRLVFKFIQQLKVVCTG